MKNNCEAISTEERAFCSTHAEKGERFLLDNRDKFTLRADYNEDMDSVFLEVVDNATEKSVVFNAADLFRQIYEYFMTPKPKEYILRMKDGEYTQGTAEDVARWYCLEKRIKLFIEPEAINETASMVLYALFPEAENMTHIAYFENSNTDIETAYGLFFSEYLKNSDDSEYVLSERITEDIADDDRPF